MELVVTRALRFNEARTIMSTIIPFYNIEAVILFSMNVDKKDILLRTISLEKRSGGFLWENIQYMNLSKGIKRCLSFLYFVQLWLEFAIPAILNKRKIETRMTDVILF